MAFVNTIDESGFVIAGHPQFQNMQIRAEGDGLDAQRLTDLPHANAGT